MISSVSSSSMCRQQPVSPRPLVTRHCHASLRLGSCDYVDFEFVLQGQGTTNWTMIHFRQQLEFRYFQREQNCKGNYSLLGRSSTIEPSNYNEVTQIHLAFVDRLDQMSISFVTNSNSTRPQCQFGLAQDRLNFVVDGTTDRYEASDMCEGKANRIGPQTYIDVGYLHRVILENLNSSTMYYYRVGNDRDGWSTIHQFRSRPQSNDETIHLIAYGDMGLTPIQSGAQPTIDRVWNRSVENDVRCILHIGDISYARGIGALWDAFMYQIEATASRFPYSVGIGNHEYDHLTGGEKDPSHAKGPGGFRPAWYFIIFLFLSRHLYCSSVVAGEIMAVIRVVSVLCQPFIVSLVHRMAMGCSGTVSILVRCILSFIRRNTTFSVNRSNTNGLKRICRQ